MTDRHLAAILSADVVGYSRLMAADEAGTVERLKTCRDAMSSLVRQHGGRVVDAVGDNLLAEFPSVVDAVACSVAVQGDLAKRNEDLPEERAMRFRIGINLGDVIADDERIYGDGVNIAARIEALAEPGGVSISGTVFDHVEGKLGLDFKDQGEHEVKNIPRPVRVYGVRTSEASEAAAKLTVPGFGGRPALAVLPFQNLSGDPEQEFFSDGMVEDLISRLSSLRELPVISRSSTLGYRGKSVDAKQVSAELGVRYVVEGSVRRSGQRVRVGAQLVDASTGHQLWSQRFDREVEDVFEIQEEIADAIAGQVGAELRASEGARAARREGQRLDAWELSARGWSLMGSLNPAAYAQARELCARAVELDPGFAKAWAGMSLAYSMEAATSKTPAESLARALETAERARDADPRSPLAHSMLGWAHGLSGDKRRWLAEQERAVELAPSSANGYDQLGVALWVNGRPLEAVEAARKAVRLSPNDPLIYLLLTNGAMSLFAAGQYEEAAEWAERSLLERTDDPRAHMWLTASYGQLGRVDAAARALEGLLGLDPAVVPPTQNVFDALTPPDYRRRFREGLRKAGWKGETR